MSGKHLLAIVFAVLIPALIIALTFGLGDIHPSVMLAITAFALSLCLMQGLVKIFNYRHLTIPGFFYFVYTAVIFLPSIFVFLDKQGPYRYPYLFGSTSVLLTVPAGIMLASLVFKFKNAEVREFYEQELVDKTPSRELFYVLVILTVAAVALIYVYLTHVKTVALVYAIRHPGRSGEITQLREESFKLINPYLRYPCAWLRQLIFPFLIMVSLGYYLTTRRKKFLLLFLFVLFVGTLFASFSMARSPVVFIFMSLFLFLYIYRRGKIKFAWVLTAPVFILIFPVFVMLTKYKIGVSQAVKGLLHRAFYSTAEIPYYYFEYFPAKVDFLYGRSIGKLSMLLGWQHFDVANFISLQTGPGHFKTGSANASFFAVFHVDFGLTGVLLGGILTGFILQMLQVIVMRRKKTILTLGLYAHIVFASYYLMGTSLPAVLLTYGMIMVFLLVWFIKLMERALREAI